MVSSNLKKIILVLACLCIMVASIKKSESISMNQDREYIHLNKLSEMNNKEIENTILKENSNEHFSFIQEEEVYLGTSYLDIMTQLAEENPLTRKLEEVSSFAEISSNNSTAKSTLHTETFTRSMNQDQMYASTLRNIMIFLPITLAIVLYFVIMSLADMSLQKNSILYAKYGTTKQLQGSN